MFSDVSAMAGVSINTTYVNWGAGFIDFDNDGWLDIFHVTGHVYPSAEKHNVGAPLKTPRILYRNLGNGKFADVSSQSGPGISQRFASRGCAFGDIDNDGDIDVAVLNMNDRPSLLRNDGGNRNNWIKLKLIGTHSNRSAIGARVKVQVENHIQTAEVQSGGSVMSHSDLRLHFGLGNAQIIDQIHIIWPGGGEDTILKSVKVNRQIDIREGGSED
jgi:hypothetical protein